LLLALLVETPRPSIWLTQVIYGASSKPPDRPKSATFSKKAN
jgi:hypothetical protein